MHPTRIAALALLSQVALASPALAGGLKGLYLDILSVEAAGEFRSQRYDVQQNRDDRSVFLGNQTIDRGTFLGGGFGLRLVLVAKSGLRFSGEASAQAGSLHGIELPYAATSMTVRGELLSSLGYQLRLGPVALHAAGIFGTDYTEFKVAQPVAASGSLASTSLASQSLAARPPLGDEIQLKRWGLRCGGQIGAHLQVAKMAALFGDATFDYDGQWRARFGVSIGNGGSTRW